MEQRMHQVEQRLDNLEKQEREYAFTVRDIAHKTTIALGILTAQEHDIKEIKMTQETMQTTLEEHSRRFHKLEATQNEMKATQETHSELLKQILMLLQPKGEDR